MEEKTQEELSDFEKAIMSDAEIEEDIAFYEKMHGFSSETLLEMRAEGKHPDTFEIQAWLALLDYRK